MWHNPERMEATADFLFSEANGLPSFSERAE
jgi:hypothetical protein